MTDRDARVVSFRLDVQLASWQDAEEVRQILAEHLAEWMANPHALRHGEKAAR